MKNLNPILDSARIPRRFFSTSLAIIAMISGVSHGALAQLSQQTGSADPGRIGEELSEERLMPDVGPSVEVTELAPLKAPPGAEDIQFNFNGLNVTGSSRYSEAALASIYQGRIGSVVSLADVYDMANAMTLKYRNDGFALTQVVVPPQTIDGDVPTVQVVEGFISGVVVEGDTKSSSEMATILKYANQIDTKGGALNIKDMERQLLLINDLPGVRARSVISPAKDKVGAAELLILVERDDFEASVGVNNHGSRFLGPVQVNGVGVLNSFLGFNEQITAQIVAAPDSDLELAYGSLGYKQSVGPYGTKVFANASITNTDPGYTLEQFDVEGLSKSLRIGAEHPIIRSRDTNLEGRFSLDMRNVESENNIEPTREDNIRAARAGMKLEFLDRFVGVGVNTLDLEVSHGLDILGASEEGDANLTRPDGDPQFTKVNARVQRLQRVTDSVNVLVEGRAQLANKALLSSEEFGLGGISSVRGYAPSEIVGDKGIAGKAEVQWNTPVQTQFIEKAQVFGFVDSGTVWNHDATTPADKRSSLVSVGAGTRMNLSHDVSAEFVAALPLHRDVATRNERNLQFFFSLNKQF